MTNDESMFQRETQATVRRLDEQLAGVDPAVALAAAIRFAALLALRQRTRPGLFEAAMRETYRDLVHELVQRAKARDDARPVAEVLPFRRAV
jgi:hypothetical protein